MAGISVQVTPGLRFVNPDGSLTTQGFQLIAGMVRSLNDGAAESFTVATLPTNLPTGAIRFCSNEAGGATLVFWDSAAWRRVQDRAVAS